MRPLFSLLAAFILTIGTVNAIANNTAHNNTSILTADNIQQINNGKAGIYTGNVRLQFGKVTITADKVLIKYALNNSRRVTECVVYGKGTLNDGKHTMAFNDGIYTPSAAMISADSIKS